MVEPYALQLYNLKEIAYDNNFFFFKKKNPPLSYSKVS